MTAGWLTAGPISLVGLVVAGAEEGPDPGLVSPGLVGFLATFGLVVAAIFLFVNMTGRLRRLDHRAKRAQEASDDASGSAEPSQREPGAPDGEGSGDAATGTDGDPPR